MTRRIPTAVLISGHGSNLQALIDAARHTDFPAVISLVISNRADAYGIVRATDAGIPVQVIDHAAYESRELFDEALDDALVAHDIQLVCLAGFMRILSDGFVQAWEGRMMNIHPSLLPAYKGLNTHARVLEAKEAQHGVTVHWVSNELDSGEIILQEAFATAPEDTVETLQTKVGDVEQRLYPEALRKVAEALQ